MNDNREVADVDTTAQPPATALAFDGRRGELAGLLFRNLLLTLATLGIYRFWAKTRVRGFLWRHVKLLDEPLEYLGSGTELLIGFLIAVVVIAPLTSVFSWLPALIPEGPRYSGLVLQALYYGTLGFLVQVAVYRVRRYRLTRTAWRGVRFGLEGSAFKYALIWCLYGAVTLATLGLAYPWLRVATTRYFANNARFGTTVFSFDGTAGRLFLRWLVVVAPATAAILLFFLVNAEALADFWSQLRGQVFDRASIIGAVRRLNLAPLGLLLFSAVFLTWYRVREFRHLVNAVRIGETRLESGLDAAPVYGIYVAFYLCVGVAGFVLAVTVGAISGALKVSGVSVNGAAVFVAALLGMGAGYWLFGLAKTLMVKLTLLGSVCETLMLAQPEALERTAQSTTTLPGHGEGLADALDVGGF